MTSAQTPLLKATDVARELSISNALAYRLIEQGKIYPALRIGRALRVTREALDDFKQRCTADQSAVTV